MAASNELGQAKLSVTTRQQASNFVPAGNVISTTPAPGSFIFPGEFVELLVSSGPERVSVPGYIKGVTSWYSYREALINVGLVGVGCSNTSYGISLTNPRQGSQVTRGTTVTVTCVP